MFGRLREQVSFLVGIYLVVGDPVNSSPQSRGSDLGLVLNVLQQNKIENL